MNSNITYEYDQYSRHYILRGTRLLFVNFSGVEKQYNNAGKRNFHAVIPPELADELASKGIHLHTLPPRNDGDEETITVKISVYEDADIRLLSGSAMTSVVISKDPNEDMGPNVDKEFGKGHVMNGHVDLEFHVARNTKVPSSSPYLRVDMLVIPVRKSKLAEAYENYGSNDFGDDDDDLPM